MTPSLTVHADRHVFRSLRSEEFDVAHGILASAADWLVSQGIRQWTSAYPRDLYLVCQENGWNYALEADGELAAIVTLSPEVPAEWADCVGTTRVWWLSKLATAPSHRGKGLGATAVRRAMSALGERGATRLCLDCVHGEGFLVDFYRRLGFQRIGRRDVQFSTGLFDMVLMEARLCSAESRTEPRPELPGEAINRTSSTAASDNRSTSTRARFPARIRRRSPRPR